MVIATLVAVIIGGSGLLLSDGGSQSASGAGSSETIKATKVNIADFKYKPASIEVAKGAKVTFTNSDTAPHTATSRKAGAFDTDDLSKGDSKAVTLNKPGTYTYYCKFHAFMKGQIKVDR